MPKPGDSDAACTAQQAEDGERRWYARVISLSLYGSGFFLLLGARGRVDEFGAYAALAGFASLVGGWVTSRVAARLERETE